MSANYAKLTRNGIIILFMLFLLPVQVSRTHAQAIPLFAQGISVFDSGLEQTDAPNDENRQRRSPADRVDADANFFISLGVDLIMVLLVVLLVYYPNYKRFDATFTFILFNISIFLITFVLNKVKISMGAAFGLFAVFSMLRYRTAGISVKDMTYLFVFIAIGLIGGIQLHPHDTFILYGVLLLALIVLDTKWIMRKRESNKIIRYERIELILPEKRKEMIDDLKSRTGLNIHRVSIEDLDLLRDCANITIYYYE